jgi:hypothetical protein
MKGRGCDGFGFTSKELKNYGELIGRQLKFCGVTKTKTEGKEIMKGV